MWAMFASQAVIGVVIAFVYSWKLTLVLLAISPLLAIGSIMQMQILTKGQQSQSGPFQRASNLAIEVIGGFSTVASFNWERHADQKYRELIAATEPARKRAAHLAGFAWGLSFFFIFAVYSLGFWYGSVLVADGVLVNMTVGNTTTFESAGGGISVGDFLTTFIAVLMGGVSCILQSSLGGFQ